MCSDPAGVVVTPATGEGSVCGQRCHAVALGEEVSQEPGDLAGDQGVLRRLIERRLFPVRHAAGQCASPASGVLPGPGPRPVCGPRRRFLRRVPRHAPRTGRRVRTGQDDDRRQCRRVRQAHLEIDPNRRRGGRTGRVLMHRADDRDGSCPPHSSMGDPVGESRSRRCHGFGARRSLRLR